jgi:hypothetical protein
MKRGSDTQAMPDGYYLQSHTQPGSETPTDFALRRTGAHLKLSSLSGKKRFYQHGSRSICPMIRPLGLYINEVRHGTFGRVSNGSLDFHGSIWKARLRVWNWNKHGKRRCDAIVFFVPLLKLLQPVPKVGQTARQYAAGFVSR